MQEVTLRACPFCDGEIDYTSITRYRGKAIGLKASCGKCSAKFELESVIDDRDPDVIEKFNARGKSERFQLMSDYEREWTV